jgi:hypothetical protein
MKHIQIIAMCDGDHQTKTQARVERTVSVDGSTAIVLDLCEQCDSIITQLYALMEKGTPVDQPKAVRKNSPGKRAPASDLPKTCPKCLLHSKSRSALGQHIRHMHDMTLRDFTDAEFEEAERRYESA